MNIERSAAIMQSAGKTPSIISVDVTAIYDRQDGRVVHLHHTITADGATRRTREDQQRSARDAATRLGVAVDGLEVLHVADFQAIEGKAYRVDVETRKLVELPVHNREAPDLPDGSTAAGM